MLRRITFMPVLVALSCVLFGTAPALAAQSILKLSSGQQIQPLKPAQPVLVPSPTQVEFGQVDIHAGGQPQVVKFVDESGAEERVSSVNIVGKGASSFQIVGDECLGRTLQASESCTVEVSFDAGSTAAVAKSATLELLTEGEETIEVPLSGEGITGTLSASASPLSFSAIPYTGSSSHGEGGQNETEELTIRDSPNAGVDAGSVSITGPDASSFSVQWGNCEHDNLSANNWCTMGIRFEPIALGVNHAQLEITSDASNSPLVIELEGEGLNGPKISMSSKQALLGEVLIGSSTWQTFTLTNTGDYPLGVQQAFLVSGTPLMFPVLSDTCSGQLVKPSASCAVTVGFQPTTIGEKDASILFITSTSLPLNVVGIDGVGVLPAAAAVSPPAVSPGTSLPSPVPTIQMTQINQPPPLPRHTGAASQLLTLQSPARLSGFSGEEALETGVSAQCPAASHRCEAESFITASIPARRSRSGSVRSHQTTVLLGASTIQLQGGAASAQVRIPLLGRASTLLKDHARVKATIGFILRADGTTVAARTRVVTLVRPKATVARMARRSLIH